MSKRTKNGNGKLKKAERKANKEGLRSGYTMVQRVPLKGKKTVYTKLVPVSKAARLIYGTPDGFGGVVKSSREYKLA